MVLPGEYHYTHGRIVIYVRSIWEYAGTQKCNIKTTCVLCKKNRLSEIPTNVTVKW